MVPPMVSNPTQRENRYSGRRSNCIVADETQQNRKPTTLAEAKSTLHGVKESSNAYPPLKSVAEHLCIVLDKCEV